METFISATSAFAGVLGIAIALLTYTSDARLHRRIARLHAAHEMMSASPSPVIHRALRGSLAELQAKEALRPQLRLYRFGAVSFTVLLAGMTAETTVFIASHVAGSSTGSTLDLAIIIGAMTAVLAPFAALLVAMNHVFAHRKDELAAAFYAGEIPSDENLGDRVSDPTAHGSWRRSCIRAGLTILGAIIGGAGVGLAAFAPSTELWPAWVAAGTYLALFGGCIVAVTTLAARQTGRNLGHSHPTRDVFVVKDEFSA